MENLAHLESEELWGHRWGYADTGFVIDADTREVRLTGSRYELCGYSMPYLLPYLEWGLEVALDTQDLRPEVQEKPIAPPRKNEPFCRAIADQFPSHVYSFEDAVRLRHSHGQTSAGEVLTVMYGALPRGVDMVFFCESDQDAEALLKLAIQHDVCLIPYGGGTSVSAALTLPEAEQRMMVAVNTRRMNKVEWIDTENMQVCAQAGITGTQLEAALREVGFTSGHEPDSMELSTLGGWISTNASGMKKNRYGNIEDIVENITLLTPGGLIHQQIAPPRMSMGMQLQQLLFGSEGNLGLITKAVLRIRPLPEVQAHASLVFPSFDQGVAFLRALSQTNFLPSSVRLVDNKQFQFGQALRAAETKKKQLQNQAKFFYLHKILKFEPLEMVAATLVMEGSAAEVEYQQRSINQLAKQFGGISGGATNGKRGYNLTFAIAYIRDFLTSLNILGETFETSVPWSQINAVVDNVRAEIQVQHQKYNLPGKPFLSCRISQVYQTGVCIYFMNGFYAKGVENSEDILHHIDIALRQVILDHGGSISHHHGVGKLRKRFLKDMVSPTSLQMLSKIKDANDPTNVFGIRNGILGLAPETLSPEAVQEELLSTP